VDSLSIKKYKWPNLFAVTGLGVHKLKNNEFEEAAFVAGGVPTYGLTWSENKVFISRNSEVDIYFKENKETIRKFRARNGLHQIAYYDKHLYMVGTGTNHLDVIDPETYVIDTDGHKKYDHIHSVDLKSSKTNNSDGSSDWNHINSVFCSDKNVYVCHHNFFQPSYISVLDKNMKIISVIEDIGSQNHNVYVSDNDTLFTLSSRTSEIVQRNLISGETKKTKINTEEIEIEPDITYLRGLAKSKDYFVCGITESHGKDMRNTVQGYLLLFDNNLKYIDKKLLPKTGQIREIRIIDETDYAHNNLPFPEGFDKMRNK